MKISPAESADFSRSVLAVPPLALTPSYALNEAANQAIVTHIEAGGVTTLLYGGNANLQNFPASQFAEFLALIEAVAGPQSWVIPSIGPDYGKLVDMARILRDFSFPCAMILPLIAPKTQSGIASGISAAADLSGKPSILYLKEQDYLAPDILGRLVDRGELCGIKYAVPRADPRDDPYLDAILQEVERGIIVSGFGEPPAIPHLQHFGLAGFTAGSVCLAPRRSMRILEALKSGEFDLATRLTNPIQPFEALREVHSPIRVLHEAMRLAGIADTGPLMPLLSNIEPAYYDAITEAAKKLLAGEEELEGFGVMAAE
ncbi:MAG: dihydrodipicolinate synthase family protein [Pseudomonadota bacterium]